MAVKQPQIQTVNVSEAEQQFATFLGQVRRREKRVVVQDEGRPVAAIVSAEDLRRLDAMERDREERFAVIDRAREAFKGVPPEEIERETDRILAKIRAEERSREAEASPAQ